MRKGFTLAEVLITLCTIGIIAALTLPTLVNNANDKGLRVKWKKSYSSLSQVTALLKMENGGTMLNFFPSNDATGWQYIIDEYAKKMNVIKKCTSSNIYGNCWHKATDTYKFFNGKPAPLAKWGDSLLYGFVTADGIYYSILTSSSNNSCTITSNGSIENHICIYFMVDVNGEEAPNTAGKDIYKLMVHNDKVLPYRTTTKYPKDRCSSKTEYGGWGCSARWLYSEEEEAPDYDGK